MPASTPPPPPARPRTRARGALIGLYLGLAALAPVAGLAPPAAWAAEPDPGRDQALLDTYRKMLADDPDQEYALQRLLAVSHAAGGLAGLIALYERDLVATPGDFGAWMVLGHLRRTAEADAEALAAYERAAALQPRSPSPHLAIANLHRALRRWEAAFIAFDRAVALASDRTARQEILRAAATTAVDADDPAAAERYLDALVAVAPSDLFLRMERASTLGRLERPERALAAWSDVEERARGQLKHLVIIWGEMAQLQMRLGELDAAEATLRRALDRTPGGHWARRSFIDGLVQLFRRQNRLAELIAELEPQARRDYGLMMVVARLYEELADDDSALARYREAIALEPRDDRARAAALRILERVGSPEEVIAEYEALVRAAPGEARHELKLAELYFQQNRPKDGFALLERISRGYAGDPGVLARVIDMWMRYGDKKTSRRQIEGTFKQLMRLEPDERTHVISLGEYYWALDERDRAHATWTRLLGMERSRAAGHYQLAEVYLDYDLGRALEQYAAALELDPGNARYAGAYAKALERAGRHQEALDAWGRVMDEADAAVVGRDARQHIIRLWTRGGRLDVEIARLERRFASEPPDLAAGQFLAEAFLESGRLEDAERVLIRLRELEPRSVEVLTALGAVYGQRNKVRDAIAVMDELAELEPSRAVEHLHRAADLALSAGDEQLALRYARQVVEINPADPQAQARVGGLYARMGYRAEAADAWRQAIALDPRNVAVKLDLAGLYRDLDQPLREEQLLAEIVRDAPEPSEALRAGRRLLQLGISSGRLAQTAQVLEPLVGASGRGVYLKLLIEVYVHMCQALVYGDLPPAEREAALTAVGERALKPLLDALAEHDVGLRGRALAVLELTHPHAAAPTLARMTQEEDALTRVQAAVVLGRIGSTSAVAALSRLLGSSRSELRAVAIWALGLVPTEEAASVLQDRYRRAPRVERALIAAAIGVSAHPAALAAAVELTTDASRDLRLLGIWALGRMGDPAAVPALAARLSDDDREQARLAAWALGRVGDAAAHRVLVDGLFAGDAVPAAELLRALSGRSGARDDAQVAAVYDQLLDRRQGRIDGAAPLALVVVSRDLERRVDASALLRHREALDARLAQVLRGPAAAPIERLLSALLEGDRPSLTLRDVPPDDADADAVVTLTILASHRDAIVSWASAEASPPLVRGPAIEVLGRWSREAPDVVAPDLVVALAAGALADQRAEARLGALRALATVSGDTSAARDALDAYLARQDLATLPQSHRVATAAAVGAVPTAAGHGALIALIADPAAAVRVAAVGVAGRSPRRDDLRPAIIGRLADPVPDVALAAVAALSGDASPQAARALEGARAYGPPRVAQAAAAALAIRP